jgi:MtrB/PioB family decaheme-associated outer membrane protein
LLLAATGAGADGADAIPFEFTHQASTMEFGLLYNSDDSYRYGDYTGLEEEGIHAIGNMDIRGRKRFDSDSTRYWRLRASNLGIDSRGVHFEYGEQGRYGLSFDFDQIPRFQTDSAWSFLGGDGGSYLSLPAGWVGANTPPTMPTLNASLVPLDVDHERKRFGGGLYVMPSEKWKLTARFDRNTEDGTKITGGHIGITGGNPRSVLIPEPVDYATDLFDLMLEYATDRLQLQMGYHLSFFDNRKESLTWENPYTYAGVWDPAAEWPNGLGRKGMPPDNRFDQLTFSGGYTLASNTRITLNAALGRMKQDESFLPYTVNALTVTTPLPQNDLDGQIDTTFVNLRIHSRPTSKLSLNASYLYDDRDNATPQNTYIYIPSDATDQGVIADSTARINHNYSSKKNEFELEADYHFARHANLSLGYSMEHMKRTHEEVDSTLENGIEARLRVRPMSRLTTGIKLGYAVRDADTYHFAEPFLSGHSPQYVATLAGVGLWENHPLLRRHYLADRKREEAGLFGTYMPTDSLSMNLNVTYSNDDYDDSELGLTGRKETRYMLDMSWVPRDDLNTYAFYSLEYLESDVDGWDFRGFAKAADSVNPARRWSQDTQDRVHTFGLGAKMQLIRDRLDVAVDYLYARSDERNDMDVGAALTAGSFPDAVTRLHNVRVGLDYTLRDNVTVRLGYLFEKFQASDWGYANLTPASLSQVVVTGQDAPDYTNHLLTWSLLYSFW